MHPFQCQEGRPRCRGLQEVSAVEPVLCLTSQLSFLWRPSYPTVEGPIPGRALFVSLYGLVGARPLGSTKERPAPPCRFRAKSSSWRSETTVFISASAQPREKTSAARPWLWSKATSGVAYFGVRPKYSDVWLIPSSSKI